MTQSSTQQQQQQPVPSKKAALVLQNTNNPPQANIASSKRPTTLSHNSTPKGKKVTILSINQQMQSNRVQQQQQQQQMSLQQQQMLFENRKRSAETQQLYQQQQQQQQYLQSKSTKVSPSRVAVQSSKLHMQSMVEQQQNKLMQSIEPQHMNTLQFYNFDMEGITPAMVSQTAVANGIMKSHQQSEDLNMDSSMHQSFINLIYPSKSKKLMSNEGQQPTTGGHHQKSKSLYVGTSSNNIVKPMAQQMAPKGNGVQKIQQSQYKKQQSIFNYSQRFKELLSDTIGAVDDPSTIQHQPQIQLTKNSHSYNPQLFSQQHSPSQHISSNPQFLVNFSDLQVQRAAHLKGGTFDNKPLVFQSHQNNTNNAQYLTLSEQQQMQMIRQEVNKTIDYTQQPIINSAYSGGPKPVPIQNTPNSNKASVIVQNKGKVIQDSGNVLAGSLHQRKPSHPVTNNFMLEILSGPPPGTNLNTASSLAQNHLINSFTNNNSALHQNQLTQYQQLQPIREKKQHQPTQSKLKHLTTPSSSQISLGGSSQQQQHHHQRSASDYTILQQQQQQLSYEGNGLILESFENIPSNGMIDQTTHSGQVNMGGDESNRGIIMNAAFSQMLYDGGQQQLSYRQNFSGVNSQYPQQQQQQVALDKLSTAQSSANIYYHRKMSVQQQPSNSSSSHTLQVKKSPQKVQQAKIIVGGAIPAQAPPDQQRISGKRKSSPSNIQQNFIPSNAYINNPQPIAQNKGSHGIPQKGVVLVKASSMHHHQQQQQQQVFQNSSSMRGSQVSSPTNKKIALPIQQQQNTIQHHTSSSTSLSQQQQLQMQPVPQQFNQQQQPISSHHMRSNSDLVKQQILAAQNAAMKKQLQQQQQQQQRPNPAINTQQAVTPLTAQQQPKAKSEMTTPRQVGLQTKGVQKKTTANIIGQAPANVSIDLVKSNQVTQRTALSKNGSTNNLAQQQQQQQNNKVNQQTPRLNKQSPQIIQTTKYPSSNAVKTAGGKRYSMQNSPRVIQQQKNYNLNQQYQMFQQVLAKQQSGNNRTENVSPAHSKQSSFGKRSSGGFPIAASKSGMLIDGEKQPSIEDMKKGGGHRRGVSETEFLLSQIRNNINTLKAYQPYPGIDPAQQQYMAYNQQEIQPPRPKTNHHLQRITEASSEQLPQDPIPFGNGGIQESHLQVKKRKQENLKLESESSYQNLPTDPNLSPYSKDLSKLQKLIKFNFRKFNEPPHTTSEFYRIGRVLGRGAFGKVNLAAHKLSEQLVAIKSINKEFLRGNKKKDGNEVKKAEDDEHPEKRKVMQEFAILKQSNHSSVVRLYDTFETTKHICFVMELCAGGDLLTYVRKRRKLTEEIAKYFFKQLIEGLAYLHHSKLIVHRDIKLDNILLDANGRIKIADFGVSRQVNSEQERMTEQCGTPAYIAPEILRDKGYDGFKVDVWSAGVCLYAMLIGTVPFKAASMQELHHLIINGKYDINNPNANCNKDGSNNATMPQQQAPKLSEHAINLIHSLLQVDPRKRLSAVEVLSHPWLKDAKEELDVFTQKEKDVIHKEYLAKNIDRAAKQNSNVLGQSGPISYHPEDTEVIFTEHNLDTRTNMGSLLKNASTKSIILAPFNSTVTELNDAGGQEPVPYVWPEEIRKMIVPKRVLKFAPKVKDLDRQYEHNNNADLDNGVYNNIGNEDDPAANNNDKSQESLLSSQDSLKKSFKETELSSDDEKAEQQMEEARRKQKMQQQSELMEFEKQIKLKYVRYQEPVEIIDAELVTNIAFKGVYPREYLLRALQTKEMNYATATYHLLLKKQQQLTKHFQQH